MNPEKNNKSTIREVLDKIKRGEVKKHPKIYFILSRVALVLGFILVLIFSVFLGSFIVFSLRARGALFLPMFGFPGFRLFISSFPWLLILLLLFLVLLVENLAKKSSIIYRNPLLYSIIAILILVVVGSFILGRAKFHATFLRQAQDYKLPPPMGSVYRNYGLKQIKNSCIGQVSELTENGFYIETKDGERFNVVFSEDTRFPLGKDMEIGNLVMVMGEIKNGQILAFGVQKIEDVDDLYWRPMNHGPSPGPMMR